MIVWGWDTVLLREFKVDHIDCPICKTKESLVFYLSCRIYFLFFIPFCPDTRIISGTCEHCGERIGKIDLQKSDRAIFNVKQYAEKAPKFSYIGISALILFIIIYFIFL